MLGTASGGLPADPLQQGEGNIAHKEKDERVGDLALWLGKFDHFLPETPVELGERESADKSGDEGVFAEHVGRRPRQEGECHARYPAEGVGCPLPLNSPVDAPGPEQPEDRPAEIAGADWFERDD